MRFIEQAKLGRGNFGTYMLTVATVFFSMVIGQIASEVMCVSVLGHSLLQIPLNADYNSVLVFLMMPFVISLFTLVLCVRFIHKQPVLSLFTSREQFDWKRFFISFAVWGAVMGAFLGLNIWLGYDIQWNFNSSTFLMLLLISLLIIPLQTSMEEVLFRGYLLQGFGKVTKHALIPIILTGVMFGLLHGANPEVRILGYGILVYYIMTGIFLGVMTHMDDGMELGLGYHAINNVFAAVVLTNNWQAFHTDALFIDNTPPAFGWDSILTLAVLQPLLLFVYTKLFKWDWKNKFLKTGE